MHNTKLDERTAKTMIDRIYVDKFVVGCKNSEGEVDVYDDLNVAPVFYHMVEDVHVSDGYHKLFELSHEDVWLFSWNEHYRSAVTEAKALGLIFGDWTSMRWLDLAKWIASGELNEQLEKWGYDYLCMTPLSVDDPDHVSWI